jgi:hypothetical protein
MTDLEVLVAGALVTFLSVAGAYVAIRHRANETPVESFKPAERERVATNVSRPQVDAR